MLKSRFIGLLGLTLLSALACGGSDASPGAAGSSAAGYAGSAVAGASPGGGTTGASGSASGAGVAGNGSTGGHPGTGGALGGGNGSAGVPGGQGAGGSLPVAGAGTGGAAGSASGGMGGAASGGVGGAGASNGGGSAGAGGKPSGGEPGQKTLRVFWLRPSDVPFDQKYPDGIAKVILEAQKYYKAELGKTFKVNDPVVETVVGDQKKSWYENTPNGGEKYWWSVTNMQEELVRKFGLKNPDNRWMVVGEISAEGDGAGGGGSPGWVILCQHDADGAVGIGGTMNRWYGGMVHELGHAFGLPDAASTDGTPMSASFYDYPNTHFSQSQKNSILNGGQSSFLF